jgi:septal ring factor EnvC (AmiA/AmiB activator)
VSTYSNALKQAEQDLAEAVTALSQTQARAQELEQRIVDLKASIAGLAKLCANEGLPLIEVKATRKWAWTAEQKQKLSVAMKANWAKRKAAIPLPNARPN